MELVKKDNSTVLTKEQLQASMPRKFRHNITDDMIDFINTTEGDEFRNINKVNHVIRNVMSKLARHTCLQLFFG
jgi:hypothetical protein